VNGGPKHKAVERKSERANAASGGGDGGGGSTSSSTATTTTGTTIATTTKVSVRAKTATVPNARPGSGKRRKEPPQPKTLSSSSPTATTFRDTRRTANSNGATGHSPLTHAVKSVVSGDHSDLDGDATDPSAELLTVAMPSFESLNLDLKATRRAPPVTHDLFDGGTIAAKRPPASRGTCGSGALWDVAAAASRLDEDGTESDGSERKSSRQDTWAKEADDDETFEVICPACTLVCDICAIKCRGCGGSLADAELAEM
jgi:hypothetical protein